MDDRPLLAAPLCVVLVMTYLSFSPTGAGAAPGELDRTFGNGGVTTTRFPPKGSGAFAAALTPQGRIVAVGGAGIGRQKGPTKFAVARYLRDGSLDRSFGNDGKITTSFGGADYAEDVTVQPDGRIVAVGHGDFAMAIVRYRKSGNVDRSFNRDGKVRIEFGPGESWATAVALQRNDRIVVGGNYGSNPSNSFVALTRLLPDGYLDPSFGEGGKVTTKLHGDRRDGTLVMDMALQRDGKIIVATTIGKGLAQLVHLLRYRRDGSLDRSFRQSTTGPGMDTESLAIRRDGRIIVSGLNGSYGVMARYLSDGGLDKEFGASGIVRRRDAAWWAMNLQSDGKILAGGYATAGKPQLSVYRYLIDGAIDYTFGNRGRVVARFPKGGRCQDIVVQGDGRIVAAGFTRWWNPKKFAVARFLPN